MLYKSGTTYGLIGDSGTVTNKLGLAIHTIRETPLGIYVDEVAPISPLSTTDGLIPKVVDTVGRAWKIIPEDRSLSIMLTGVSGMGKTKCAHTLASELGLPIILCKQITSETLMTVLGHIGQPVMLLFDEFEKYYTIKEDSESMLTFFDGMKHPVRLLNVLTMNETRNVSQHIFNRPGRVLFNFTFNPLTTDEVINFVEKKSNVTLDREKLMNYVRQISDPSYDICDKIAEVVSMFPETYDEVIPHLNISVGDRAYRVLFTICFTDGREELAVSELPGTELDGIFHINNKLIYFEGRPLYIRTENHKIETVTYYTDAMGNTEVDFEKMGIESITPVLEMYYKPKYSFISQKLTF